MKIRSGIYRIRNTENGKVYIGSAFYLRGRHKHHVKRLSLGLHRNCHLQNAWDKYGADKFNFQVILCCSKSDTLYYEQRAIDSYTKRIGREFLYNLDLIAGSAIGRKHSEETKRKIGLGRKGKKHSEETLAFYRSSRKGIRPSDEAREKMSIFQRSRVRSSEIGRKISAALKGRKHSKETIDKIRKACKGKRLGIPFTDVHKQNISESKKGIKLTDEHKRNIGDAHRGTKLSEEHKVKIATSMRKVWEHRNNKFSPVPGWDAVIA